MNLEARHFASFEEVKRPESKIRNLVKAIAVASIALAGTRYAPPQLDAAVDPNQSTNQTAETQNTAETQKLIVERTYKLNGTVDDIGWAGSCLLAINQWELYRYHLEQGEEAIDPVPVETDSTRDWVQLMSGPRFGIAVEGSREYPPDRPRRDNLHIPPETLNTIRCQSENTPEMLAAFGNDWKEFIIGGAINESRVYYVGASDKWSYYDGENGCCEHPTLAFDSLKPPAPPIRITETPLWWYEAVYDDTRNWKPTFSFATERSLVAVSGSSTGVYRPRQTVVSSIDNNGAVEQVWRIKDFSGHIELHNGDLYGALGKEIRRYTLKLDGEAEYESLIAPSGVAKLLNWGDSLVAVVKLAEPTESGKFGAVYELQGVDKKTDAEPEPLSLRYVADFDWVDFMGAKAEGRYLVIYPWAQEGIVVMERQLPWSSFMPKIDVER